MGRITETIMLLLWGDSIMSSDIRPNCFTDNPEIVIKKVYFSKGLFGGGQWKVEYCDRRSTNVTTEICLGRGSRGRRERTNCSVNGTSFMLEVNWG